MAALEVRTEGMIYVIEIEAGVNPYLGKTRKLLRKLRGSLYEGGYLSKGFNSQAKRQVNQKSRTRSE